MFKEACLHVVCSHKVDQALVGSIPMRSVPMGTKERHDKALQRPQTVICIDLSKRVHDLVFSEGKSDGNNMATEAAGRTSDSAAKFVMRQFRRQRIT